MQAAILLAKLKHINTFLALRRNIAKKYSLGLAAIPSLKVPFAPKQYRHVYGVYTVRVLKKRQKLLAHLQQHNIGARIYYSQSLSQMKVFKTARVCGKLTGVKDAVSKVLSLPIFPFLKYEHIDYITRTIRRFYNE